MSSPLTGILGDERESNAKVAPDSLDRDVVKKPAG